MWGKPSNWCDYSGTIGDEKVGVAIFDHPSNPSHPVRWHARGYGLFAANPLGEKIFTNGKSEKNLRLKKGESIVFRYRIVIDNGSKSIDPKEINTLADSFEKHNQLPAK